jgi:hypothetical protein
MPTETHPQPILNFQQLTPGSSCVIEIKALRFRDRVKVAAKFFLVVLSMLLVGETSFTVKQD